MLSALQQQVARIVAALPEANGFALAGGAALVLTQIVDRQTRDLDFFGASADDVDRLLPCVRAAMSGAGLAVRIDRQSHGFARLTVTSDDDTTELDLAADARIRPTEHGPLGPVLSIEELAADKLLALFAAPKPGTSSTSPPSRSTSDSTDSASWPPRRTRDSLLLSLTRCSARSDGSRPPTST